MVSKKLLVELKAIMKSELNLDLNESEIEEVGSFLLYYHDWLLKNKQNNNEKSISRP